MLQIVTNFHTMPLPDTFLRHMSRDGTRTHQQLAAEYKLKEEAVKKLSTIARIPTVISDKNDKDMFVAK
jgi:hypothetical protein